MNGLGVILPTNGLDKHCDVMRNIEKDIREKLSEVLKLPPNDRNIKVCIINNWKDVNDFFYMLDQLSPCPIYIGTSDYRYALKNNFILPSILIKAYTHETPSACAITDYGIRYAFNDIPIIENYQSQLAAHYIERFSSYKPKWFFITPDFRYNVTEINLAGENK